MGTILYDGYVSYVQRGNEIKRAREREREDVDAKILFARIFPTFLLLMKCVSKQRREREEGVGLSRALP